MCFEIIIFIYVPSISTFRENFEKENHSLLTQLTGVRVRKKYTRKVTTAKKGAADAANGEPVKPKRIRKVKDPNAAPAPRKRKTADEKDIKIASASSRQSKPTEANATAGEPAASLSTDSAFASQKSKIEDIPRPITSFFSPAPPTPAQQQSPQQPQPQSLPRTSGQNYDPIRSSNYDPVRETVVAHNPFTNNSQASPKPPLINRASASPSISSLIDPPNYPATSPHLANQSFFNQQNRDGPISVPASPTIGRLAASPLMGTAVLNGQATVLSQADRQADTQFMRASAPPAPAVPAKSPVIEPAAHVQAVKKTSPMAQVKSTNSSSTAASPKMMDIEPPPLPGSAFPRNGTDDGTESRAPTIILHIPLKGETNKYVNFTRLAEERYGWDALHPRLAAQRERLARVAAAGAALEKSGSNKDSGDEMSVDLSEGEGSNVEMGGMSDGRTGTDGGAKKVVKKRKTKEDEYDKDDGFVDDSEMLWEEQAAASKDGFFVYSGPLVAEGEQPQLERSEPAKRGRGGNTRGGKGARGGATAARGGSTAAAGTGTRGATATRKPRVTKADRARMEQEKAEREKQGLLAAKPAGYSNSMGQSPPTTGGTPMVFNS